MTVVTTLEQQEVRGITVNAFMSVSLDPPLVVISIDKNASAHAVLARTERYGVSMLHESQEAISNAFAGFPAKGLEVRYRYRDGFPLVEGAVAHLLCCKEDVFAVGDHTLYVGRVEQLEYHGGNPLLYYRGEYGKLERPQGDPLLDG